ncbi:MAG: hypothetical protein RHS_2221 [Robinsoniella sp. RHS]|nr:MAG: hypothetical protein RHS_2221 [Robinsoniella sp. RHS]
MYSYFPPISFAVISTDFRTAAYYYIALAMLAPTVDMSTKACCFIQIVLYY